MTKIVDIEDIRKKREKKEIGIPIENMVLCQDLVQVKMRFSSS